MKTLNFKSLWNNIKSNCSKAIDKTYNWIMTPIVFSIILAAIFIENIAMMVYFICA